MYFTMIFFHTYKISSILSDMNYSVLPFDWIQNGTTTAGQKDFEGSTPNSTKTQELEPQHQMRFFIISCLPCFGRTIFYEGYEDD